MRRAAPLSYARFVRATQAEGHDDDVLRAYPFEVPRLKPRRLVFEAKHLAVSRQLAAATRLRTLGYSCLRNCPAGLGATNASGDAGRELGQAVWKLV